MAGQQQQQQQQQQEEQEQEIQVLQELQDLQELVQKQCKPRRIYRQIPDVFKEYSEDELLKRFMMDSDGLMEVTNLVRERLKSRTERSRPLSPETKVAITLRYLATGEMQHYSSNDFGTTQSTISRAISQTIDALCETDVLCKFISFPHTEREVQQKQAEFLKATQFPGVVGVINGHHVGIIVPRVNENHFVNARGQHSINVQVVFDAQCRILDLVARWPGSVRDVRILDNSGLKSLFEEKHVPSGCYLLGDNCYPCRNWLLTPYVNPHTYAEDNYNRVHRKALGTFERGIALLKRRFHILQREVRLSPEKTCKMVNVCALLHNICVARNIPLPDDGIEDVMEAGGGGGGAGGAGGGDTLHMHLDPVIADASDGYTFRDYIANLHFNDED